ncbi:hypothetical protein [Paenibacillus sp. 1P07SE]|uniref:hypothetical protein n=1 Tax=Paenibacillus sp. 1P07SE TaxID=3132209 RepID=UPI0039A782FA
MKNKAASLLLATVMCASLFGTSFVSPGGHIGVIIDDEALQLSVAPVIKPNPSHDRIFVKGSTMDFPDQLPLPFEAMELEQVEALQAIPSTWQKKSSLRLGQVEQTELVLDLYEFSEGVVTDIHGIFSYRDQLYVMKFLNAGRDSEVRTQHLSSPIDAEETGLGLVSVIGTEYVTQWLLFDTSDQQWRVMRLLGEVVGRADDDLMAQFPGTGMNPPAASIVRIHRDGVETANLSEVFRSFADSHDIPFGQVVTRFQAADGQADIKAVLYKDGQEEVGSYRLDGSTLRSR